MKKVSIIAVNWNTKDLIKKCADTIHYNTTYPYELIIVDNGSIDGSVKVIKDLEDDSTRAIFLEKNMGYAGGNNCGIQQSTGEIICLINSDVFVTSRWLESMVNCMNRTGAGMVGPWTRKCKGKQRHKLKYLLIPKRLRPIRQVTYLCFFCVLIARNVINKIGLLDESFGIGTYEDDDFCRRAVLAGFTLYIDGKAWVWHEAHATMNANNIDKNKLMKDNSKIYKKKWLINQKN